MILWCWLDAWQTVVITASSLLLLLMHELDVDVFGGGGFWIL